MAKIFIEDGNRRFQNTGYGQLARSVMRALINHTDHQISMRRREDQVYSDGIPDQALFDDCPHPSEIGGYDLIFRVGFPGGLKPTPKPTVLYTQNALGGLPTDWAESVTLADALIVPGEFDRTVFARHNDYVHVCPQIVDTRFWRPMPEYRKEGPDRPSFLFVGSFGYRKGTDLICDAVARGFPGLEVSGAGKLIDRIARRFGDGAPVNVHLHCFTGLSGNNLNILLAGARRLPSNIRLSVDTRSLTLPWMRRMYQQHDAVFTLSRGEGWCMPLWEGLFCGLPAIAPDSTAMGEWLPKAGVERVKTREVEIAGIKDPFAASIVKRYGEPGVTLYEPEIDDAARAFRAVYDDLDGYKRRALANRDALADRFSVEMMAEKLNAVIADTLERVG